MKNKVAQQGQAVCARAANAVLVFFNEVNWEEVRPQSAEDLTLKQHAQRLMRACTCGAVCCKQFRFMVPAYVLCWIGKIDGLEPGSKFRVRSLSGDNFSALSHLVDGQQEIDRLRDWVFHQLATV